MSVVVHSSPNKEEHCFEFSVIVRSEGQDPSLHRRTILAAAEAMKPQNRSFELLVVGPPDSLASLSVDEVSFDYSYCHSLQGAIDKSRGRWLLEIEDGTMLQYPDLAFEVSADSPVCPPFTAHNIGLEDGSRTRPGQIPFEQGPRALALGRILNRVAAGRLLRVADLGALEMGFAVEVARMGHEVLALEGRQANVDRFRWLEPHLNLSRLTVVCDDVRNVASHGRFDVVLCLGLLYHLDKPCEGLEAITSVTADTLIIDTHVAIPDDPDFDEEYVAKIHEGLPGRWYREFSEGTNQDDITRMAWSSLDNPLSFWLEPKALRQLLNQLGFPLVMQVQDVDSRPNRHLLVAMRDDLPSFN